MVSAAFYDPGGMVDLFGMLATEINTREILLTDAISWSKGRTPGFSYELVMKRINFFNQRLKFQYNIVEANNTGTPVIHGLIHRYKMRVMGITTGRITTEKAKRDGKTMDKEGIVDWINIFREKGIIKFPKNMTQGLYELKAELDNFGAKRKAGKIVHEALVGHDDLISCLKLAVHFAKQKYLRLPELMPTLVFDGAPANDIHDPDQLLSKEERLRTRAKNYIAQKGTPFDRLDVRFG